MFFEPAEAPEISPQEALKIVSKALEKPRLSVVPDPAIGLSSLEKAEFASVMNLIGGFKSAKARELFNAMKEQKNET